jgi:hypothetical protein
MDHGSIENHPAFAQGATPGSNRTEAAMKFQPPAISHDRAPESSAICPAGFIMREIVMMI